MTVQFSTSTGLILCGRVQFSCAVSDFVSVLSLFTALVSAGFSSVTGPLGFSSGLFTSPFSFTFSSTFTSLSSSFCSAFLSSFLVSASFVLSLVAASDWARDRSLQFADRLPVFGRNWLPLFPRGLYPGWVCCLCWEFLLPARCLWSCLPCCLLPFPWFVLESLCSLFFRCPSLFLSSFPSLSVRRFPPENHGEGLLCLPSLGGEEAGNKLNHNKPLLKIFDKMSKVIAFVLVLHLHSWLKSCGTCSCQSKLTCCSFQPIRSKTNREVVFMQHWLHIFPRLAPATCFLDFALVHVFPRSALDTCIPSLGTSYMFSGLCTGYVFSRARHWLHVFPRLVPATHFPVLGTACMFLLLIGSLL